MLHFPLDADGKSVCLIINPNVYDNPKFIKETIMARLFSLGVRDIAKQLVSVAAFTRADKKKPTKKMLEPHIEELLEFLDAKGIEKVLAANADYFAFLTGKKFEASVGTETKCKLEGYEHITVLPIINPIILKSQPTKRTILELSFLTASQSILGTYDSTEFEFDTYECIRTAEEAKEALEYIKTHKEIAWDIETTGLSHITSEIITQAFAVSEKEAYTFVCHEKYIGKEEAKKMHKVFKDFFRSLDYGNMAIHNIGFESKFLMSKYIMNDWKDYLSMYKFLDNIKWDDTMLIAYTLMNSTERLNLDLKSLAKAQYGDWDSDINVKDAINQPIDKLAYYNAIDVSATMFLKRTLYPQLLEGQRKFYETEVKNTQMTFTKLMATGIPMDMNAVLKGEKILTERIAELDEVFYANAYIKEATEDLHHTMATKYNESHKVKQVTSEFYEDIKFNPNSNNQLQDLIYINMGFEVTEKTKAGKPSTARAVLEDLLKDGSLDDTRKEVLECLIGFSETEIILKTFIASFKRDSIEVEDGVFRLYGNLRVGGTISFRPSANNPNLLNSPSGPPYGDIIKSCFSARDGFIIATSDHASLQGRTGANLTKDPALIKIYNENIDLHSYMTVRYWPEEFEAGHPDSYEYYEWVKKNYTALRKKSKGITFACQFGGGPKKIAKMLGVEYEEGLRIWKAYHATYVGVSKFGDETVQFALERGYVPLGLGLRLQTPTLTAKSKATIRKLRNAEDVDDADKVAAEARQGGHERSSINARTQFWDYLTLQGLEKFYRRVQDEGLQDDVIPHSTVYDSIYMEVRNDPETIKWVNDNLIECMIEDYMEEQPVKLVANLDIGSNWGNCIELPNSCDLEIIQETLSKF